MSEQESDKPRLVPMNLDCTEEVVLLGGVELGLESESEVTLQESKLQEGPEIDSWLSAALSVLYLLMACRF